MNEKLLFLTSTRFWALVLGVLSVYLNQKGLFGEAEMKLVAGLTAIFITIRTVDRTAEMLSE